jgi:hypothetical protein
LATIADIDDVQIPVLHINHLIAHKKALNRPKDQLDVIYFEKIRQLRGRYIKTIQSSHTPPSIHASIFYDSKATFQDVQTLHAPGNVHTIK